MEAILDHAELRRRSIDGLGFEIRAFGSGSPGARVIDRPGLLASVCPATPDRSIFNSVLLDGEGEPEAVLDELAGIYEQQGVRAWTAWVPPGAPDRLPALLRARGHLLDGEPRTMALALDELTGGAVGPEGLEAAPGERTVVTEINDRAYGYEGPAFRSALAAPSEPPIEWAVARVGGLAVSCAGTIAAGDDLVVTGVATLPDHRGRGIAGALLQSMLSAGSRRGCRSASLQASPSGAPVYTRLGFRDFGSFQLWERRPAGA
jgi:GNAT superfamily N-acetyltransferase